MAIDDLLDEHEQSERVRNWLKNNGAGLIGGIALGLAVIFGWQWWGRHQAQQKQQAFQDYATAQASLDKATAAGASSQKPADLKSVQAEVAKLAAENELYANLAALRLAKAQVESSKRDEAIATLKAIKPTAELKPVVDLRLARLLADAGKHDEALKLIGNATDADSLVARADILAATGKPEQARELYLKALTGMDVAAPQRRLVELKLTDVGGTPPKPAEAT